MQFQLLSLLALTGITIAAPAAVPEEPQAEWTMIKESSHAIQKRTVGGMYLCTDWHFLGTCGYAVQPLNQCIHLDSPWWHSVSSMGPDSGTVCNIYSDYSCNTLIYRDLRNPGSSDLGEKGINDQMGSFQCRAG